MAQVLKLPADCGNAEVARLWRELRRVDSCAAGETFELDATDLKNSSGAFEAFYLALDRHAAARGMRLVVTDPAGVLAAIRARYDFAAYSPADGHRVTAPFHFRFLHAVGERACERVASARAACAFLGETLVRGLGLLVHPLRFRFADAALAFERAGFDGLPITILIGFLLGLILAFESAASLRTFGVEVYVADLIAIGLFRELGPLVTAIILAGRSGSAFAAEIGTMKVDEELDALTTFGLPPVRFLVLPRILAAALAMPVLTIAAELAGLVGGAIVLQLMNVPVVTFWAHVAKASHASIIVLGLAKSALFGLLVGLIGCASGLRTRNTADGVGVAATTAVVGGIIAIAVSDGLIAVLCYIWGI